jgi:putative membrane protein
MNKLILFAAPALLLSGCAGATSSMATAETGSASAVAANPPLTAMDYLAAAGASDQFEIQSSQLALQKAARPEVKAFAQMMVDHHTKTTADLTAAAQKAGLTPPPPTLTPDKAAMLASLQTATDFDTLYMRDQVAGHQEALALHEGYGRNGDQAALRTAAQKTAPIVRGHLERAQALAKPG